MKDSRRNETIDMNGINEVYTGRQQLPLLYQPEHIVVSKPAAFDRTSRVTPRKIDSISLSPKLNVVMPSMMERTRPQLISSYHGHCVLLRDFASIPHIIALLEKISDMLRTIDPGKGVLQCDEAQDYLLCLGCSSLEP